MPPSNYTVGLPIAASTYAARVDSSLHVLHTAMIVIFVLWAIFFVYCLFRFRQRPSVKAVHSPTINSALSFIPDLAVLVFEVWIVFLLGLPVWAHIKEDFPKDEDSNVVEMVAEQFAWNFQYAGPDGRFGARDPKQISSSNTMGVDANDPSGKDDIIVLNELHVPLGKPTILYMTSKDVIHSFFVPEFRVKQDVVPGMRIPLWFEANQTGTFEIGCAQLCGLGHYRMKGSVVVQSPEDFEAWKQQQLKEKLQQS